MITKSDQTHPFRPQPQELPPTEYQANAATDKYPDGDGKDAVVTGCRVALLTAAYTWSGVEVHTISLMRALREHGHQAVIIELGRDLYSNSSGLQPQEIVRLDIANQSAEPLSSLSFASWVKLFRTIDCDIAVAVKGTFKFGSLSMEAAARLCFRKFIAIEHLHAPLGVRPSTSHLGGMFGGLGIWWHRQRFSGYLRSVFPEKVICVSNALAETLRSDYAYPEAKVIAAYSGIDTSVFRPDPLARSRARQTWDIPATAFVFGSVGRLSPMKNHAQLVRAFHTLLCEDPDKDIRLVIVGEGPERESLEALIQSSGLEGKVLLAGFSTKPEEVVPAFDVFCFPSLTGESLGLTLLETMSCEIPAIASAVGGVPEILNNDQLGWLIPSNDEDALRTAMRKAAMTPTFLLTRMGKQARKRVIEHFEARKRWKELVEQICDSAG